jgi:N-acetyl-anhydromuramyl-L-alanine amidase AmpD
VPHRPQKPEGATHLENMRPPDEEIEEATRLVADGVAVSRAASIPDPTDKVMLSPNYTAGWPRGAPRGVTIHTEEGYHDPSVSWLRNPESWASAHFCIRKDGLIVQLVWETNRAWHARNSGMHYFGIEHEGGSGLGHVPIMWKTPKDARKLDEDDLMLQASARLTCYLCMKWDIRIQHDFLPAWPPERGSSSRIAGHAQMPGNDHMDPGPHFPWRAYMNRVHEIAGV